MGSKDRIAFLDYLRALACLVVVFGHVYLVGIDGPSVIAPWVPGVRTYLFGEDSWRHNVFRPITDRAQDHLGLNLGAFGVCLFFLISGFVILRAVERESITQFVVRRIFRIYPVTVAAAVIAGAATWLYCQRSGQASPHTWRSLITSGLVLDNWIPNFAATPVLWSLQIELAFYVLIGALAALRCLGSYAILTACLILAAVPVSSHFTLGISQHESFEALQLTFLLVGAMIWRVTEDRRPWLWAVAVAAVSIGADVAHASRWHPGVGGVDLPNGLAALLVFMLALRSGMEWEWIKPLRWIAAISYPLYLVHLPLAWLCLAWLASRGWTMLPAGVVTAVVILLAAWMVELVIAGPAHRFGARLSNGIKRSQ